MGKGVTVRVDEDIYDKLDELSECIGYPKNEPAPIQYTVNWLLRFAISKLPIPLEEQVSPP